MRSANTSIIDVMIPVAIAVAVSGFLRQSQTLPRARLHFRWTMADSSLASRPIAISVVMSGAAEPSGKHVQDHIHHRGGNEVWTSWDLRTMLKDPVKTEQVHWKEDGQVITTVQAIYCQHNCAEVALTIVKFITDGNSHRLVDIFCRTGHHRADTIGRTVVELLNGLVEPDGTRIYNAQCFPLAHINKTLALQGALDAAVTWVDEDGWTDMPGGERDLSLVYGYEASTKRKDAMATFDEMWGWVAHKNQVLRDECEAAEPDSEDSTEWYPDSHTGWKSHATVTGDDDDNSGWHPRGSWKRGYSEEADDTARKWSADVRVQDENSSWKHARTEPSTYASNTEGAAASGEAEPLESWMHFGPTDARAWLDELTSRGVDRCAQQELMLLSQHSERGHGMANSIIAKMFKKESDGVEFNNVSGFIHTAVKNKRDILGWD